MLLSDFLGDFKADYFRGHNPSGDTNNENAEHKFKKGNNLFLEHKQMGSPLKLILGSDSINKTSNLNRQMLPEKVNNK